MALLAPDDDDKARRLAAYVRDGEAAKAILVLSTISRDYDVNEITIRNPLNPYAINPPLLPTVANRILASSNHQSVARLRETDEEKYFARLEPWFDLMIALLRRGADPNYQHRNYVGRPTTPLRDLLDDSATLADEMVIREKDAAGDWLPIQDEDWMPTDEGGSTLAILNLYLQHGADRTHAQEQLQKILEERDEMQKAMGREPGDTLGDEGPIQGLPASLYYGGIRKNAEKALEMVTQSLIKGALKRGAASAAAVAKALVQTRGNVQAAVRLVVGAMEI